MVPQPRVGRRRSTTPHHITDVAIDMFTARGFADVSVDDVAQAAGISRRTGPLELSVERAAPGGDCIAHAPDGRVVFLRGALPGERVRALITDENRRLLRADTVEVLQASPDRVTPPCPIAVPGKCGGCDWQHATVAAGRHLQISHGSGSEPDLNRT